MGTYDEVKNIAITLPLFDFGGGAAETYSFRLPTGYKARLVKIGVAITETFAVDSSEGSVQLGTAADANAYAQLNIADAAADNDFFDETDDTNAIIAEDIAADVLLRVTLTNGTDGTGVTGQGIPIMHFELYQN